VFSRERSDQGGELLTLSSGRQSFPHGTTGSAPAFFSAAFSAGTSVFTIAAHLAFSAANALSFSFAAATTDAVGASSAS
jgi:hypothetical protein